MSLENAYTNSGKGQKRAGLKGKPFPRLSDDDVAFAQAVLPLEQGGLLYAYDKQDLTSKDLHNKWIGSYQVSNGGNGSRAFTTRYPLARKALANAMEALPLSNSRGTVKHSALPFNLTHLYGAPGGGEGPQGLEWEARKASILATVKDREAALAFVAQNQAKLDKMYQAKQEHVAAIDKTAAAAETQKKTELKVIRAAIDLRQKEEAERQRETEERRQKATDAKQALVSANEEESEAKASLVLREQELMVAGGEALQRADGPIVTWYQMEEIQRVYSAMLGMRDESDTDERWQDWQEVLRIIYDCEEDTEFRKSIDEGRNIKLDEDLKQETLIKLLEHVRQPRIFERYGTNRGI